MNDLDSLLRQKSRSGRRWHRYASSGREQQTLFFESLERREVMAALPLAPLALDDLYSVNEDRVLIGNVIAGTGSTGVDAPAAANQSLKAIEVNGQNTQVGVPLVLASGATLMIEATGSFRYDPTTSPQLSAIPAGQSAADSFTYTVAPEFSNLFVFGDSLSDQGRLFAATGGAFPPDPPYHHGRFSNGPVWAEQLAPRLGLPISLANNFAVGGATTGTANYNESLLGADLPGLADEVSSFVASLNGQSADPDALYVVFAGGNDFFLPFGDPAQAITQAVTNLASAVGALQAVGTQHVMVVNLPDLGLTPFAISSGQSASLTALSAAFNAALTQTLATFNLDVTPVDLYTRFQHIVSQPQEFGLTDVSTACFDGASLVCDPDKFLFWDSVHPTAVGHGFIAEAIFAELTDQANVSIEVSDVTSIPQLAIENHPGTNRKQLVLNLSASDGSVADQSGQFTYQINWGDGTPVETIVGPSDRAVAVHNYTDLPIQRVTVSVVDQDGDSSVPFREIVTWGTNQNDQLRITRHRADQFRIRLNDLQRGNLFIADFDRVVAFGLIGHDSLSASGFPIPVEFDGGAGNDILRGGRANDILRGGSGKDVLFGEKGDDRLNGDAGHDALFGGEGIDWLDGLREYDSLVGRGKRQRR